MSQEVCRNDLDASAYPRDLLRRQFGDDLFVLISRLNDNPSSLSINHADDEHAVRVLFLDSDPPASRSIGSISPRDEGTARALFGIGVLRTEGADVLQPLEATISLTSVTQNTAECRWHLLRHGLHLLVMMVVLPGDGIAFPMASRWYYNAVPSGAIEISSLA